MWYDTETVVHYRARAGLYNEPPSANFNPIPIEKAKASLFKIGFNKLKYSPGSPPQVSLGN